MKRKPDVIKADSKVQKGNSFETQEEEGTDGVAEIEIEDRKE